MSSINPSDCSGRFAFYSWIWLQHEASQCYFGFKCWGTCYDGVLISRDTLYPLPVKRLLNREAGTWRTWFQSWREVLVLFMHRRQGHPACHPVGWLPEASPSLPWSSSSSEEEQPLSHRGPLTAETSRLRDGQGIHPSSTEGWVVFFFSQWHWGCRIILQTRHIIRTGVPLWEFPCALLLLLLWVLRMLVTSLLQLAQTHSLGWAPMPKLSLIELLPLRVKTCQRWAFSYPST